MARTIIGTVSSNKTDKTIVVTVQTRKTHPLYRKQYTVNTKFMAHDEKNEAEVGDKVSIVECRPISKRKRFNLKEIIEKPVLREDSLSLTKTDDSNLKASKSKVKDEDSEEPKDSEKK
jgi:small subunit ribosomal protein S17